MSRSRLDRVRSKRAGKEGIFYLILAALLVVGMLIWGLPAVARLVGYFTKTSSTTTSTVELQPAPPIFSDIPEATYSAKVKISGFAQPGLDVHLFVDGSELDTKLVAESGTFTFDNVPLTEGDNAVYAYTQTPHNLKSEQSQTYTITLDTTKPVVTITSPHDGDTFNGQSARIVTFTGSVNELGSKVVIGGRMAILSSDGTFSMPFQLVQGSQVIPIVADDKAGNEGTSSITLTWNP